MPQPRRRGYRKPRLTISQILAWADAHFAATGEWPNVNSGGVRDTPGETWCCIDANLRIGGRGLKGPTSLARLLDARRGVRNRRELPPLSIKQILKWADLHKKRTGRWPSYQSGPIPDTAGETWVSVNVALRDGKRGLAGSNSLAQLLAEERSSFHGKDGLSEARILSWVDAFHRETGRWPNYRSGPVRGALGETWAAIEMALREGCRGLPGGSSLAKLLADRRGVRNKADLPDLTVEQVVAWAENHRERTGRWPTVHAGPVPDAPGEKWANIQAALVMGRRGLDGGTSLAQLTRQLRSRSE